MTTYKPNSSDDWNNLDDLDFGDLDFDDNSNTYSDSE